LGVVGGYLERWVGLVCEKFFFFYQLNKKRGMKIICKSKFLAL